jgi:hypothetical protein
MCGRYTLSNPDPAQLRARFGITESAVRKRATKGSLDSRAGNDGKLRVLVAEARRYRLILLASHSVSVVQQELIERDGR